MLDTMALLFFLFVLISPPLIYLVDRWGFESVDTQRH